MGPTLPGRQAGDPLSRVASSVLDRLSALYAKILTGFALLGCSLLFLMMLMISADVVLRNLPLAPEWRGLKWSNDISELMLFLIAMMAAPWLLRRGQHIRVDILLFAVPKKLGWYLEWICDALVLACCATMVLLGTKATLASIASGSFSVKTIAIPEWWLLAPLPIAFALLGIEAIFRMRRLYTGLQEPRHDAASAG